MEEYNNDKYMILENVENLFKRIKRFGNEYNYCFGTFVPQSALPVALGAVGGLIEAARKKKVSGYFLNKNEREICLIPLISDDNKQLIIDLNGYIDIRPEAMKKIKIKNEDFIYKRITIVLNDGTKYIMNAAKKIKGADYHQENLQRFIDIYK